MPRGKYDPTVNIGDTRCRIYAVAGRHMLGQPSSLTFSEEEVIKIASSNEEGEPVSKERSLKRTRAVRIVYDPSDTLALRHPDTDQPVGEMPMGQAFMVIYSLGRLAQLREDERVAAEEAAAAAAAAEEEAVAAAAAQAEEELRSSSGMQELQEGDLEHPIPEGEG